MNQSLDSTKKKPAVAWRFFWKTEMSKEFSREIIAFESTLVCNCEFLQFQKRANLRFIIIILGNFQIFLSFLHFRILIILSPDLNYLFESLIFFLPKTAWKLLWKKGIWYFSPLFKKFKALDDLHLFYKWLNLGICLYHFMLKITYSVD